jgi:hypothetical protein
MLTGEDEDDRPGNVKGELVAPDSATGRADGNELFDIGMVS